MMLNELTRILFCAVVCLGLLGELASAQTSKADTAVAFLRRLDANRDGMLDPNEIPDRSRAAVERLAREAGEELGRPLKLDRLEKRIRDEAERDGDDDERRRDDRRDDRGRDDREREGRRGRGDRDEDDRRGRGRRDERDRGRERGRDRDRGGSEDSSSTTSSRGFGGSSGGSSSGSRGFGGSSASGAVSEQNLEDRFDDRIIRYVDRFLSQYDKNKNGRLDNNEWGDVRWGSDPKDSDLNKDGHLTRAELCARMEKRWGNRSRDSNSRGDRERSGGGDGGSNSSDDSDRVKRYAAGLLKRYDSNENGVLEKDEWGKMRSRYADADANKDSVITSAELALFLGKGNDSSSSSGDSRSRSRDRDDRRSDDRRSGDRRSDSRRRGDSNSNERKSYRFLTPTERLERTMSGRIREEFIKLDANADGQITMAEFSKSWSDSKVKEFLAIDKNQDGIITPAEFIAGKSKK